MLINTTFCFSAVFAYHGYLGLGRIGGWYQKSPCLHLVDSQHCLEV
ncbi:protein of unknown function [Moritella yayanosii]|uniref:Uncharacterized protein n=1 Tax=Moritella yayanosii TaxID=69539 RepID=A0A330LLJ0_9GAMM|nr:protein of unknown function [Moritella yayanosii]